jgi:hypothetical protein
MNLADRPRPAQVRALNPYLDFVRGFVNFPLDSILPCSRARAASERVLTNRTTENHLSILTRDMISLSYEPGSESNASQRDNQDPAAKHSASAGETVQHGLAAIAGRNDQNREIASQRAYLTGPLTFPSRSPIGKDPNV